MFISLLIFFLYTFDEAKPRFAQNIFFKNKSQSIESFNFVEKISDFKKFFN
jgi:hypothetical protein